MDRAGIPIYFVRWAGAQVLTALSRIGGMVILLSATARWAYKAIFTPKARFDVEGLTVQMVRVGVKSVGVVALVQVFIGVILALQMTPPLEPFGQEGMVSNIIGVAGFRMLGPIITAVVLSGFAGASIAAELGTMVVSEEIEAMEAIALNPIRYLVVPRILATFVMTILLTIIADWMIAVGGWVTSRLILGPESYVGYWGRMQEQLRYRDFITGLIQAGVFGILISLIACYEGLKVTGGAEGVGRATTNTVVYSIVAIVIAACICTMIFYAFEL